METFVGESLRLTVGALEGAMSRGDVSTPHEEFEQERRIASLVYALDERRRVALAELYHELTGRSVPHEFRPFELSGEAWAEEVVRALRAAATMGHVRIEPVEFPRVAVRQEAPGAPLEPTPSGVSEQSSRFEVRLIDEVGEPLEGVELAFSSAGTKAKQKTDASGVARFESKSASFGSVQVVSTSELAKLLDERWSKPRTGSVADAPYLTRLFFGAALPSVQLESDASHTVVFQPELGKLHVELWDKKGRARHANTEYHIAGPVSWEGTTDADGRLVHEDVPSGDYTLTLTQTFPEELGLPPETYEVPLVVLPARTGAPQVRRVGAIPRAILARLRGMVFDTNKTFLLPTALPALLEIRELYERERPTRLLIVGHTDTTGEPAVNDPLSLERAESVRQYLMDDVDAWLRNYDASVPQKKRWGPREDRLMMLKLAGYDTRPPEQNSVLWFQEHHNALVASGGKPGRSELATDGKIGPKTRTELIFEYMSLDGVSLADPENADIDVQTHGAGENFPLDASGDELDERSASGRDGESDQRDRRVELFFFDDEYGVVPAPTSPAGEEYLVWRKLAEESVDTNVEGVTQKATVLAVPSAHFRTGSAVLLPEGEAPTTETGTALTSVGMLAMALRFNEEHEGHSLLVAGHTDSVGSDAGNDALSEKRAQLTHAVLMGNRDEFVEVASETGKVSDWKQIFRWAAAALPTVPPLTGSGAANDDAEEDELPEGFAAAEPGQIDDNGATGQRAARAFQEAYNENRRALGGAENLQVDGVVGKKTWGAIFDLYQYNLAEELGEDFDGLKKLREQVTFLPGVSPFIGFGETFPVSGAGQDELASQENRRVEVLLFARGHEPDLAILAEEPKLTELYSSEAYEREQIDMKSATPHRGVATPLRIWLLDDARKRMGADPGSSHVLERTFGAPYRLVLPDGSVRVGYANADGLATEYHLPSRAVCELAWGRALAAGEREELPEDEALARDFFRYRTRVVVEDKPSADPLETPLANMGLLGARAEQLAQFGKFYGDDSDTTVLRVHRRGLSA